LVIGSCVPGTRYVPVFHLYDLSKSILYVLAQEKSSRKKIPSDNLSRVRKFTTHKVTYEYQVVPGRTYRY